MNGSSSPPSVTRVVLLGFMAAGKTEVGAELARRLGWTHVDLDREIEREHGRSIRDIFAADGEAAFRRVEAGATERVINREQVVLTPGGGWITRAGAMDALGEGTLTVWLVVSPEEAVRRAAAAPGERPLLAGPDPLHAARRLLDARRALYAAAALHVDTEGRSPAEIAQTILAEIRLPRGSRPLNPKHD